MKKTIVLLIGLFLLSGCSFYDEYEMPEEVTLKTIKAEYEVYSKPKIIDLIEDKNVKILNENEELNTNKTGTKKSTIEYEYEDRKYKYDVEYNIVDTTPPIVLYTDNYDFLYKGDSVTEVSDYCENAIFIDNYDRKVNCKIEGTYDVNTVGTYELKYIISDKDNNVTEETLTFEVLEPPTEEVDINDDEEEEIIEEEEEDDDDTLLFDTVINKFKNKNTLVGIDVSRWQKDIDFKKVKAAGADFVIIRIAVSNGPDDEIGLDSKYKENIKNAKKAGLKVGVYLYTSPATIDEVKEQAKFIVKELDGIKLDFPIGYDFENWEDVRKLKINTHDLIDMIDEFYDIVHEEGYDVMLYSSKYYLEKIWLENSYPKWLAHYIDKTNYEGDYIMWQMANNGLIDGIDTLVDIDIYYKRED